MRALIESSVDEEVVKDELELEQLLQFESGSNLMWLWTPAGHLFRYWDTSDVIWRFTLSWSALREVCDEAVETIAMVREPALGLPR